MISKCQIELIENAKALRIVSGWIHVVNDSAITALDQLGKIGARVLSNPVELPELDWQDWGFLIICTFDRHTSIEGNCLAPLVRRQLLRWVSPMTS